MTMGAVHARSTSGTLLSQKSGVAEGRVPLLLVTALGDVFSWNKQTLRSQVRLAPAPARSVPERDCKRVRSQSQPSRRRTRERSVAAMEIS
jgi:hypothetical protein